MFQTSERIGTNPQAKATAWRSSSGLARETDSIGSWHHRIGNQAMLRVLRQGSTPDEVRQTPWPIQAKLEIGSVSDPLEREADSIADQVMRMPEGNAAAYPAVSSGVPGIRRKCSCGGSCDKCRANEEVQDEAPVMRLHLKPSRSGDISQTAVPAIVYDALRSPGQALDPATRTFMEARFQRDFSSVRIHRNSTAERSAQEIGAAAYTVRRHIVFSAGRFAPETSEGRRLIAHELTHVVQQSDKEGTVQRQPATKPRNKRSAFASFLLDHRGAADYTLRADEFYFHQMEDHLDDWDTPEQLWAWAKQKEAEVLAKLSEPSPVRRFGDFYLNQKKYVDSLPAKDRKLYEDALERFYKWFNKHMEDPDLGKYDPAKIWEQAFKNSLPAEEKRVERENLNKIKAAHERKLDFPAIDKKLKEVEQYAAREIYREKAPDYAEDPSEHRACLDWSAPANVRKVVGDHFIHFEVGRTTEESFTRDSAESDFHYYLSLPDNYQEKDAFNKVYHECSDTPREEIATWRKVMEIGFGFLPIVGQIMGGYEVLSGREFWTNEKISGTDRAILAAAMFLPVGVELAKGKRAASTVEALRDSYKFLSDGEARALLRATAPVKPGSEAAQLLDRAADDVVARRAVKTGDSAKVHEVIDKMGMTDSATLEALGTKSGTSLEAATRQAERTVAEEIKAFGVVEKEAAASEIKGVVTTEQQASKSGISKIPTKTGHELYVTPDGRIFRCSDDPCTELAAKFATTLDADSELAKRLEAQRDKFRQIASDEAAAEEAAAKKKGKVEPEAQKQLKDRREKAEAELKSLESDLNDRSYKPTKEKPLPVAGKPEQQKIDEYVAQLNKLNEAREAGDKTAEAAANKALDNIEELAFNSVGKKGDQQYLLHHIETLIDQRATLVKGEFRFPYLDPLSGKLVEGIGRKIECEAVRVPAMAEKPFREIEENLNKLKTDFQIERRGDHTRLTWKFPDKSRVEVDIPGPDNKSIYQVSREPHATRIAPPQGGLDLHLSDTGVGVPSQSAPAHIRIVPDATLEARIKQ